MINKEEYNKNGYVILKKVFDPRFIDQLRQRYIAVFKKLIPRHIQQNLIIKGSDSSLFWLFEKNTAGFKNCGLVIQNMLETYQLMLSPEIMLNVNQLLADPCLATKAVLHTSHPKLEIEGSGYWQTPAHVDGLTVIKSLNSIVVWTPLVDCSEDSIGPLMISPGSHLSASRDETYENAFAKVDETGLEFIPAKLNKGDVLIFNVGLVHKSGLNNTNNIRWALSFRFADIESKDWQARNYHDPYLYKPIPDYNYKYSAEDVKRALDG